RERLAARGQAARETRAEQLGFATADLIDRTLAGRFPTALARGLAEHHVLERVATEPSPSTDVEPRPDPSDMRTAVRRTLDDPRLAELVSDVLASRLVADVADRV